MNSLYKNALKNSGFTSMCNLIIKNGLELKPSSGVIISTRNTFILKRKYPVKLTKKGIEERRLKGKDYVYELVENTENKKHPDVAVILKENIDGIGLRGECVKVKRSIAYNKLLVTGLADFASPEAIEEAKRIEALKLEKDCSSPYAPLTVKYLETQILGVVMNKEVDWTLEPWHIRVAFRKAGFHVPTECIELPHKPINGPNLDLESKIFCVTVTINKREKATVRCRLHHWSTDISNRLPYEKDYWVKPLEPMFPEDADLIQRLSKIKIKSINM